MSRTDARALEVPEALPVVPVDVDSDPATAVAAQSRAIEQFFNDRASAIAQATSARGSDSAAPAPTTCPACSAKLSGVEQKLGRCLSCGKTHSASGSVNVGI
jgi:hypothetical protein